MTSLRLVLFVSLIVSLFASYLLHSSPDERLAILVRDGRENEAAAAIERNMAQGRATPQMLLTLARLQDSAGDTAKAVENVEQYLILHRPDEEVLRWLLSAYERLENLDGVMETLGRYVQVVPRRDILVRLATLFRYHGRYREERELLERFSGTSILNSVDHERLAHLLASEGQFVKAADILQSSEDAGTGGERSRLLLFECLLRSGQFAEATRRASAWGAEWRKPWLTSRLTLRLALDAPTNLAIKLSTTAAELHPDARLYLAKSLADQDNSRVARHLLAGWPVQTTKLDAAAIREYMFLAASMETPDGIWRKLEVMRKGAFSDATRAAYLEAYTEMVGLDLFNYLPSIPHYILYHRPLFGARIAIHLGHRDLATSLLVAADIARMTAQEQREWLALVLKLHGPAAAMTVLRHKTPLPPPLQAAHHKLNSQFRQSSVSRVSKTGLEHPTSIAQ
jgi:tetratricopeptide (TPR) repeat protein